MFSIVSKLFQNTFVKSAVHQAPTGDLDAQQSITRSDAGTMEGVDPIIGDDGILRRKIAISDIAMNDPVIMGLRPELRMVPVSHSPEHYTLFQTAVRKAKIEETPEVLTWVKRAEIRHAHALEANRIFLSQPGEIPGLKRLAWLGPAFCSSGGNGASVMIAVTDEGRLIQRRITPIHGPRNHPVASVADLIEVMRHGKQGVLIEPVSESLFDLNHHSRSARTMPEHAVNHMLSASTPHLMRAANACYHASLRQYSRKLGLVRWAIADALDPEALRIMRGTMNTSTWVAEYLTGGDGVVGGFTDQGFLIEKSDARKQAMKSYPILSSDILNKSHIKKAVDDREPLADVLAKEYKVEASRIRRLQGLTWQKASTSPRNAQQKVIRILSLSAHHVPKTRAEHRSLTRIDSFAGVLFGMEIKDAMKWIAPTGSPYKVMEQHPDVSPLDVTDAINFLADKLYVPAMVLKLKAHCEEKGRYWSRTRSFNLAAVAQAEVLRDFSFKELMGLTERYHRNIERYTDKIEKIRTRNTWPALTDGHFSLRGVQIKEMCSSTDLIVLGREENHCVGGYDRNILNSNERKSCIIFKLDDGVGNISTLELALTIRSRKEKADPSHENEECIKATIVQNRAKANGQPVKKLDEAAKEIAKILAKIPVAHMRAYLESLSALNLEMVKHNSMPSVVSIAGYEPWNDEHMKDAWDELSPNLPRSIRKAGFDRFIKERDIEKATQLLDRVHISDLSLMMRLADLSMEDDNMDTSLASARAMMPDVAPCFWEPGQLHVQERKRETAQTSCEYPQNADDEELVPF